MTLFHATIMSCFAKMADGTSQEIKPGQAVRVRPGNLWKNLRADLRGHSLATSITCELITFPYVEVEGLAGFEGVPLSWPVGELASSVFPLKMESGSIRQPGFARTEFASDEEAKLWLGEEGVARMRSLKLGSLSGVWETTVDTSFDELAPVPEGSPDEGLARFGFSGIDAKHRAREASLKDAISACHRRVIRSTPCYPVFARLSREPSKTLAEVLGKNGKPLPLPCRFDPVAGTEFHPVRDETGEWEAVQPPIDEELYFVWPGLSVLTGAKSSPVWVTREVNETADRRRWITAQA